LVDRTDTDNQSGSLYERTRQGAQRRAPVSRPGRL